MQFNWDHFLIFQWECVQHKRTEADLFQCIFIDHHKTKQCFLIWFSTIQLVRIVSGFWESIATDSCWTARIWFLWYDHCYHASLRRHFSGLPQITKVFLAFNWCSFILYNRFAIALVYFLMVAIKRRTAAPFLLMLRARQQK